MREVKVTDGRLGIRDAAEYGHRIFVCAANRSGSSADDREVTHEAIP